MFKYKQKDKEDYILTAEDLRAWETAAKASFKEHKRLTRWENAVKLKYKQK